MLARLLIIGLAMTAPAWAQEYDDPAIVVCELLVRANYEIDPIRVEKTGASIDGSKVEITFDSRVLDSAPAPHSATCPFVLMDDRWELDTGGHPETLASISDALAIIGFYPIPESATALR